MHQYCEQERYRAVELHLLGERLDEIALTMKEKTTKLYSRSKQWNSKEKIGAIAT